MGVVYRAEDTKLERTVALKFLAAHAVEDPDYELKLERSRKTYGGRLPDSMKNPNRGTGVTP